MSYRAKINDIDSINKSHFPKGFRAKVLHKKPYIVKLKHFINKDEINAILDMAKGKFTRSTVILNDQMEYSTTRTSHTAYITDDGHKKEYNKHIDRILKKACYLVGCERNKVESLMVVRYKDGQQYYNHHDYFDEDFTDMLNDGSQRIATYFVYLNGLERGEGGETEFPEIGVKSNPEEGTAVFWWNTDKRGRVIPETLHRGNPVKGKGKIKYGLNIWIREEGW
jgi:prolyl 4-hydroxylase